PSEAGDFVWLRRQGIELLISLTEDRPRRDWVNDAGLLVMHVPVEDMDAPTQEQLDRCVSAIERAHAQGLGVAVHRGPRPGRAGAAPAWSSRPTSWPRERRRRTQSAGCGGCGRDRSRPTSRPRPWSSSPAAAVNSSTRAEATTAGRGPCRVRPALFLFSYGDGD